MSIEFKLPAVGENIDKAEIGGLRVAVGDSVAADQIVMEIETDKAVFELPCPHAGKVSKIHVKPGDSAVQTGAAAAHELTNRVRAQAVKRLLRRQLKRRPRLRQPRQRPRALQSPRRKLPGTGSTRCAAALPLQRLTQRAPLKPPKLMARKPPLQNRPNCRAGWETCPTTMERKPLRSTAGPATRRLARELGVDLYQVHGSGPGGRITSEDVQAYVRERLAAPAAEPAVSVAAASPGAIPPLPDFSVFGTVERQQLNKVTRTGAANLSLSWNIVPHVTQHELADVTELEEARQRYSQSSSAKEGGPKITMTVLAMKAVVTALKAFPKFNSLATTPLLARWF